MTRLTIEDADDFALVITCAKGEERIGKAEERFGKGSPALSVDYSGIELPGITAKYFCPGKDPEEADLLKQPFFFDNTDYIVWIELKKDKGARNPRIITRLKADEDMFIPHGNVLTGTINFGNDVGKSDLAFRYEKKGIVREFRFGFTVLSRKLDYKTDHGKIVGDLEAEYPMLAFDYLKRTHHSFNNVPNGNTPNLIWWNLFRELHGDFIRAVRLILDHPRRKSKPAGEWVRADQLKRLTPALENEFEENSLNPAHRYLSPVSYLTNDTMENRFLKYALGKIARKFAILKSQACDWPGVSDQCCAQMNAIERELNGLKRRPFFQGIGNFTGLNQASLVLQQAAGYADVTRIWAVLLSTYAIKDGEHSLETKDIATLYEIWCFLRVGQLVEKVSGVKPEQKNRIELNRSFCYDMKRGKQSRILFKTGTTELAEVLYNSQETDSAEGAKNGVPGTVSPTVPQRPDIILRLTKAFGGKADFKLTYLFDAKYRLNDTPDNGNDAPPEDAINQMHRYRDAIYYEEKKTTGDAIHREDLKREVIGGYILFPGRPTAELGKANFTKSIKEVNIGAFPFRPGADEKPLEDFLQGLLKDAPDASQVLSETIPQKGTLVQVDDVREISRTTLFGTSHGKPQIEWIRKSKLYNLPVEEGLKQGITNATEAQAKRLLVLVPSKNEPKGEVRGVLHLAFIKQITKAELRDDYHYYQEPSHESYWLWRIE